MAWAQQSLAINEFKCALPLLLPCTVAMRRQQKACSSTAWRVQKRISAYGGVRNKNVVAAYAEVMSRMSNLVSLQCHTNMRMS